MFAVFLFVVYFGFLCWLTTPDKPAPVKALPPSELRQVHEMQEMQTERSPDLAPQWEVSALEASQKLIVNA